MSLLIKITSLFDKVNQIIGRNISWFIILMVIVQLSIVMARYIYGIGFLKSTFFVGILKRNPEKQFPKLFFKTKTTT